MGLGNRRFVVLGVAAISVALALAGCSATGGTTTSDASAIEIGQDAIGFTPSDSSTAGPSGLQTTCSDSLRDELFAGLPATDTVTTLDSASTHGVGSDPTITNGYTPSCAFAITVNANTVDELYFVGMSQEDQEEIVSRIPNEGFVAGASGAIPDGNQQLYTRGTSRIDVGHLTVDGVSILLVAG